MQGDERIFFRTWGFITPIPTARKRSQRETVLTVEETCVPSCLSNFREIDRSANILQVFFNGMSKGRVNVVQVRAIKLRVWPVINIFSQNVPESSSMTTEEKNIILKAYSTQKVGSGGNFESGNQVYGRREIQTHEAVCYI